MNKKNYIAMGLSLMAAIFGFQSEAKTADESGFNVITAKNTKIKFYGFARIDAHYDDSRTNSKNVPAWINTEDESVSGTKKNEDSLNFNTKLTRFGFALDGPNVKDLNNAKVTGKIEADFWGRSGFESRNYLRMRHAYLQLAWDNFNLLAGQTSDLISPLYPAVNPDMVMWGAGNLADRRPQIRGTYNINENFTLQGMIGSTGATDNSDLDATGTIGNGVNDGDAGTPTFQARASFKNKKLEIGVWAHEAEEDPGSPINLHGADDFRSHAVGYDLMVRLTDKTTLKSEGWMGYNLDDVRGGINQGINTNFDTGSGITSKEIDARGGWIEVAQQISNTYSLTIGHSQDNPRNNDLNAGTRSFNKISYLANRWKYGDIHIGLDYLYWKTKYKGLKSGLDNRFAAFIAYYF